MCVGQLVEGVVEDVQPYGVFFNIGEQFSAFLDVADPACTTLAVADEVWLKISQFADWNQQVRVTLASDREAFITSLKRLDRGSAARIEGEYIKLKAIWDRLSPEEQQSLRAGIGLLVEASELLVTGALTDFHVKLEYVVEYYDEAGDVVHSSYSSFMPKIAMQALDAWDRGEEFSPTSLFRLLTSKQSSSQDRHSE